MSLWRTRIIDWRVVPQSRATLATDSCLEAAPAGGGGKAPWPVG